jgi:hypothetical protein
MLVVMILMEHAIQQGCTPISAFGLRSRTGVAANPLASLLKPNRVSDGGHRKALGLYTQ